jgi:DNA repair exonuclease SbcCD ATPase subunit
MGEAEPRWMTYRALADELGISVRAAEARARRNVRMGRWRHRIDNEPPKAAQVLVLPADLEAMRGGTEGNTAPLTEGDTAGDAVPHSLIALVTELHQRAEAAEARTRELAGELATQRERAGRAEGERDALREAFRTAQATAEEAGRRARTAEDRAAAAHQRTAEITAVMGRVAEGLEHLRQAQATAVEAVAAAKAERDAAQAKAEDAAQRSGEAEARVVEASRRAEAAEARLDELQRLPADTPVPDSAELEVAQARATEAERQAAEARRRADEAERRATVANERWDRFQQKRIAEAQEAATRATDVVKTASPEAEVRPLWHRIFRRRT